ncbi:unnamed protein product [Symbiodinium pilosum]|uniref:PDZ domain-containing protein n=1 Tax=Symbiodinium pilosum TaxID=2952 RepID=A0A812SQQ2_SYMPI|nr:unnamed protein product [Symbiodinium pilosum]
MASTALTVPDARPSSAARMGTPRLGRPQSAASPARVRPSSAVRQNARPQSVARGSTRAGTSTATAAAAAAKPLYPIPGDVGYYQRADVKGRVKKPKLDKDMAKLKDLFAFCEDANFREVRAMVSHYPYLLSLTDAHGFSALNHSVMSGEPSFVAKVLQLYRDPKTFSIKNLVYETEEELMRDVEMGVEVVGRKSENHVEATVVSIGKGTKAEEAGLMPGDKLEACSGTGFLSYRQPPPLSTDILEALRSKYVSTSFGFPVTLEFRGNAAVEILAKDGWTPTHGAAGRGARGDKQVLWQLLGEEDKASLVQDMTGCTPGHWAQIEKQMRQRANRRPLSAGPCGSGWKRRPAKKASLRPVSKPVLAPSSADAEEIVRSASRLSAAPAPCVSRPMSPASPVDRSARLTGVSGRTAAAEVVGTGRSGSIGATAKDLAKMMQQSGNKPGHVEL